MYASRKPSSSFGRDLGRLIRDLHSFPSQRALDLGLPYFDGPKLRADRAAHYETVIRRAFPLIACEARAHVERTYEAYLNDDASFDFEPVLVHSDIAVNALINPESGDLCGLIDFGDAAVSSPALDLWLPVYGFDQLGIADQRAECLTEAGITDADLDRMRLELAFIDLRYPMIGILHGLATRDDDCVAQSIVELNALVPRDIRCE